MAAAVDANTLCDRRAARAIGTHFEYADELVWPCMDVAIDPGHAWVEHGTARHPAMLAPASVAGLENQPNRPTRP
jgi:hypothetical protein